MKEQKTKHKMEELSIEITYKCPMKCIHCSSSADYGNETMIPKEDIIGMIKRCSQNCGTTDVSLSGGEPFEHPDFWSIMEYIKSLGLDSIVYSCGIQKKDNKFIPYTYDRLSKLRILCDRLIISLHGSPDKHNEIMNIDDDAFRLATETIRRAVEIGIKTEIHFVPTSINYKDLMVVYGICLNLGVSKMSVLRYVPQGRGLETAEKEGKDLNLSKLQMFELNTDMKYLKDTSKNNDTEFRIGIPADFTFLVNYFKGDINAKKPKACTGGKTKILVKADGLVQVCPAWKELDHLSAGSIYEEDIVDIWENGKTYCEFRNFTYDDLKEPCKSCKFLHSCLGGCSAQRILANNSDMDGIREAPDPLCFLDLLEKIKKLKRDRI